MPTIRSHSTVAPPAYAPVKPDMPAISQTACQMVSCFVRRSVYMFITSIGVLRFLSVTSLYSSPGRLHRRRCFTAPLFHLYGGRSAKHHAVDVKTLWLDTEGV